MESEKLTLLYELLKEFDIVFSKMDELRIKHDNVLKTVLQATKPHLTLDEAAEYLSISKSELYKKTSLKKIPFYKPGKQIYFKRDELDNYIFSYPQK